MLTDTTCHFKPQPYKPHSFTHQSNTPPTQTTTTHTIHVHTYSTWVIRYRTAPVLILLSQKKYNLGLCMYALSKSRWIHLEYVSVNAFQPLSVCVIANIQACAHACNLFFSGLGGVTQELMKCPNSIYKTTSVGR